MLPPLGEGASPDPDLCGLNFDDDSSLSENEKEDYVPHKPLVVG